jgi:hypothetical protein
LLRPTGNASNAPAHPIIGDVIGFALRWDGQQHGVLWISGEYCHPHPLRRLERFQEGRDVIEREFANAHEDVRRRIRWIPLGAARNLRKHASAGRSWCHQMNQQIGYRA